MTDLIDLNYHQAKITSKRSSSSYCPSYQQQNAKVYCIHQVIQKFVNKIDKINIKTVQFYVFQLDKTKVLFRDIFYYYPVKIVGVISLGNGIFSLRIQFFDQKGGKISAKTHHHRTVISSFAFQINAELQNFKLQHNPVSGQFSFIFNIKAQYLDKALVSQLVEFALDSYFEECAGHFYILHLIQYLDGNQNQYLKSVEQDFGFLKQWVKQRQIQNRAVLESYTFYQKFQRKFQTNQTNSNQKNVPKRPQRNIKIIQKYLSQGNNKLNIEQELCSYKVRHAYKRFKKYYEEDSIIRSFLTSKIKYQNILTINPKETNSLLEFMSGKSILKEIEADDNKKYPTSIQRSFNGADSSFFSPKSSKEIQEIEDEDKSDGETNEEILRVWDRDTGKCYCVKMLHLKSNAKNENFFVQKLCKFQSFYFINQYVHLENYLMQNEFILVNVHPRRTTLSDFLQKNNKIISLSSRMHICINLIQIVYTLHMKNKIQNYFPHVSIRNLQISRKMTLSFKTLSSLTIFPLYELVNSISMIIFDTPFNLFKKDNAIRTEIVKGDEIQNKNWGLSLCIYFLRYYLFDISEEVLQMIQINDLKINKKTTPNENKDLDQWKKDKLTKTCEELLVIFSHFQTISSRGYEESYNFEEASDSEEVSDSVEIQT